MKILVCSIMSGFRKSGYVVDMLNLINHIPLYSTHSCVYSYLLEKVNACFECQERRKAPGAQRLTGLICMANNLISMETFLNLGAIAPQFLRLC